MPQKNKWISYQPRKFTEGEIKKRERAREVDRKIQKMQRSLLPVIYFSGTTKKNVAWFSFNTSVVLRSNLRSEI